MAESRRKLPCTCGKKRVYTYVKWFHGRRDFFVRCPKCGLQTDDCRYQIEAIRAWNDKVTAMLAKGDD